MKVPRCFPFIFSLYVVTLTEYEELKRSIMELTVIILWVLALILVAFIFIGVKIKRIEERIGKEEDALERLLKEKKNTVEAITFTVNAVVLAFSVLLGATIYQHITYDMGIMLFFGYLITSYTFYRLVCGQESSNAVGIMIAYITFSLLLFTLGFVNIVWYLSSALIGASTLTAETFYFLKRWREGKNESN